MRMFLAILAPGFCLPARGINIISTNFQIIPQIHAKIAQWEKLVPPQETRIVQLDSIRTEMVTVKIG